MKSAFGMTLASIGFVASGAAQAGVTIDIVGTGSGVTANAAGTLNLTDLTENLGSFLASSAGMVDFGGDLLSSQGLLMGNPVGPYTLRSGPTFTGPAYPFFGAERDIQTQVTFDVAAGNLLSLGYVELVDRVGIGVANDYVSGDPIAASGTWNGLDLARLGMTAGTTFTWSWGSGPTADFLTINVTAVPEPATYALLLAGLGLVGVAARRAVPR